MTDDEIEDLLRRYLSWRTANAKRRFPDLGVGYILHLERVPFYNENTGLSSWSWVGNVLISYSRGVSVPVFRGMKFRKRIDAVRYVLESFSGGKSPEEIVLEMEAFGV